MSVASPPRERELTPVKKASNAIRAALIRHSEKFNFINERGDFIHVFLFGEEEASDRVVQILKSLRMKEVQKLFNRRLMQHKVICRWD